MPTFYQRFEIYKQHPDAVAFSKKKLRRLQYAVVNYYNKNHDLKEVNYVDSCENNIVYHVRNYPDHYTEHIDRLIWMFHKTIVVFLASPEGQPPAPTPPPLPTSPPRKRKRIPAFSGKPLLRQNPQN